MILEITLTNFFSMNEKVTLDLQAANIQTKEARALADNTFTVGNERLLKTVAIYGANASGKSNIIKAIKASVDMILQSHNFNEGDTFGFKPFKFGSTDAPSEFYIRFLLDGIEHEYSFSCTRNEIITESLYHYPKGRKAFDFSRDERNEGGKKTSMNLQLLSVVRSMLLTTPHAKHFSYPAQVRWIVRKQRKCTAGLMSSLCSAIAVRPLSPLTGFSEITKMPYLWY